MTRNLTVFAIVGLAIATGGLPACMANQDALERRSSWTEPTADEVKLQVMQWLEEVKPPNDVIDHVRQRWDGIDRTEYDSLLSPVIDSLALAYPDVERLANDCRRPWSSVELPDTSALEEVPLPPFVRDNIKLFVGIWFVEQRLYNEARAQIGKLTVDDVVDPTALLFYQSIVYHRLLEKEQALATLTRLLEKESTIPRRYSTVARMMQADLAPLKPDSLDEISRLMDSIHVRLGHGRAGKRVRKEEDDVVAKLDKLIDKLQQQAQQSQSSSGSSGNLQPSQPMQDSQPAGGSGPGNVDPKRLAGDKDWGNLPPKDRQEALQQIGRDFPSHYREVIEEYFRILANDAAAQP